MDVLIVIADVLFVSALEAKKLLCVASAFSVNPFSQSDHRKDEVAMAFLAPPLGEPVVDPHDSDGEGERQSTNKDDYKNGKKHALRLDSVVLAKPTTHASLSQHILAAGQKIATINL